MIHDGVLATLCAPALAVAIQRSDEGWGFRPMSHASGMGSSEPARAHQQPENERLMKHISLSAILLLALGTSSYAMGGGVGSNRSGLTEGQIGVLVQEQAGTNAATATSHLVQNSAECAPDQAEPIWGPGQQMIGYTCHEPENN